MADQKPLIKGKVAKILDSRSLVINRGRKDGVRLDMIFQILDKPEVIKDPDSGNKLGAVERPKVKVKVTSIEEKFAIAETYRVTRVNVGGTGIAVTSLFTPPKYEDRVETLKTKEHTWEDLSEADSIVKTGDSVIEVRPQIKPKTPTVSR